MAQQKALKNTAARPEMIDVSGRSPAGEEEQFAPVFASGTGAEEQAPTFKSEEQLQPALTGSAANPPTPQTPYTLAAGQMGQTFMKYGAPVAELGAGMAVGSAGLGFLPGMLVSAGVGGAASALFDVLRNQTVTDPSKKLSAKQIFENTLMSAGFSALGEAAGRGVMKALFDKAKSSGNQAILKEIEEYASQRGEAESLLGTAEQLGMKFRGADVTLTPQEAFPLDPKAAAMSASFLKEYPGLGSVQGFKLQKIKEGILDYAGSFKGASISNISAAAENIEKNYVIGIKRLQDQVNTAAEGSTFRNEAEQILGLMRSEIENAGGKFEGDVLTFHDEPGINAIYNVYKNLRKSISIPAQPEQYSKIVGTDGKPFVVKEATPEGISPLSINDINRVLKQVREAAAFGGEADNSSKRIARKIYNQVVEIRDGVNISIAQKSGNEALAQELRSARDLYKNNIDGLRVVQENLSKEPSNVIPYLIKKDNPAEFSKIFSVLTDEQKVGLKGDFLSHMADPMSKRARGLIPDESFKSILDDLMKYDPKILQSIYTPKEFDQITRFLKLGERVEQFGGSVKAEKATGKIMDTMWLIAANPKFAAVKTAIDKLVSTFSPKSNIKNYLDARSYLAGIKKASEVSADALAIAEKKMTTGVAIKIATPRAVMQGAKELFRERPEQ